MPTPDRTLTLEEWTEWAATATRPYTDSPIGTHTAGRRQADALASQHVTATNTRRNR